MNSGRSPTRRFLKDEEVEIPVQVNGKLRGRIVVRPMRTAADRGGRARTPRSPRCSQGKTVRKVVVVPGKLVNFVVG